MQHPLIIVISLIGILLLASSEQMPTEEKAELVHQPEAKSAESSASGRQLPQKRDWNQMQGVWGKRSSDGDPQEEEEAGRDLQDAIQELLKHQSMMADQDQRNKRSSWNQLQGAWGKRTLGHDVSDTNDSDDATTTEDENDDDETAGLQWGDPEKRSASSWGKLHGAWGKRTKSDATPFFDVQDGDVHQMMADKRDWNQFQGAWGKRNAYLQAAGRDHWDDKRGWNELHSSGWGKRDQDGLPAFDYHHLMAGPGGSKLGQTETKRSWSNLRGSWGKRELTMPDSAGNGNEWSRKRESGWNNLKGLWG